MTDNTDTGESNIPGDAMNTSDITIATPPNAGVTTTTSQSDPTAADLGDAGSGTDISSCPPEGYHFDVSLIPQPNKSSCWAASMAMLVSYHQQASLTPEDLAQEVGRSLSTSYSWDMLEEVKNLFGFQDIQLPSNASLYPAPQQWCQWLGQYGPLWVTTIGTPAHAIIVLGLSGDGTPDGTTIEINNPWDIDTTFSTDPLEFDPPNNGKAYMQAFNDFAADFGLLGLANYGDWRVLYLPETISSDSSK